MEKASRLYPNGFLFSDKKLTITHKHYKPIMILDSYYYYYDEQMKTNIYENHENGTFIIIHGHFAFVNTGFNITNLIKDLLDNYTNDYERFLDTIDFIGGRFVILVGDKKEVTLFQDAAGMRTVYYSLKENIISSHVHHINDIVIHEIDESNDKINSKALLFDATPYTNIKSLNPNMYLKFFTKEKKRFFPRRENKYNSLNEREKFELIEYLWKEQMNQYVKRYPNFIFSLTGGSDSRILLAMAREHLNEIKSFTYSTVEGENVGDSVFEKALEKDKLIVRQILKDIPLNHRFFYFKDFEMKNSQEEINAMDKNTIKQHGRWLIPFYNQEFPENNVMHLRGNLLEIGRAYFIKPTSKNTIKDIYGILMNQVKKYFSSLEETQIKLNDVFDNGIQTLEYDKNLFGYHILDLYYWEIRMGRWFSEVLNETDSSFDTFLPFNMRAIIDLTLSFELEKRKSKYVFTELINRNYPILNFYGKNNVLNLYEQLKNQRDEDSKEPKIIELFSLLNSDGKLIKEFPTDDNMIYIPAEEIKKECYSEANIKFNTSIGLANICIHNRFTSQRGSGYLKYQVLVNSILILEEDISKWSYMNHICLMNLKKGDLITIRIIALRNASSASWENASKVKIVSYAESLMKSESPVSVTCTSPHSVLFIDEKTYQ